MEAANQFQNFHHSIFNAMQLTNFSFLNSRMDYLDSQSKFKSAVQRISSGSKMEGLRKDVGAYSQGVNARLSQLHNNSYKTNLQNTRSFLEVQEQGLRQVLDIYDRMDVLTVKALDPTSNPSERKLYDEEFKSLSSQLEEIMKRKFNGDYLYSNTVVCGGVREIALGELDLLNQTWSHAIRAETVTIGSPAGTLSFRVNSGRAGDTYRVWLGSELVFSLGSPPPAGTSVDHRKNYNTNTAATDPVPHMPNVPADNPMGSGWRTSDGASSEDDDLIEVTFEPGKATTYKIFPGGTNRDGTDPNLSAFNTGTATGDPDTPYTYTRVTANPLPEGFDNRELTLQIETTSIGKIYDKGGSSGRNETNDGIPNPGITFTPIEYNTDVEMNAEGDTITLDAKGFGTLADASPVTGINHTLSDYSSARDTLDHLRGNPYANDSSKSYYGEEKCVVNERLASIGAEMSRIDKALESLERKAITDELTISRIEDADVAQEATNLATASIKTQMSAQVMSKSTRLKDILIPLTTDHFRSSVLSAKL
jgi:flagellin-like hook-associated protein FlgL